MKIITNKFGCGSLYDAQDLNSGKLFQNYCLCTACMSVYTDFLSWAVNYNFTCTIEQARNVIVLGCQVTDLAIYNDIQTIKKLHEEYPEKTFYMGGCLAQRFDIPLPDYVRRLDVVRDINCDNLNHICQGVDWQNPFWIKTPSKNPLDQGNLFRNMYPLKIGAGCSRQCKYCTIRHTRGKSYEADALLQIKEFLDHDNVVLISDNPTRLQVKDWCLIAKRYKKLISIRNLEPTTFAALYDVLDDLAKDGYLNILHCPIQSDNVDILRDMNRNEYNTLYTISGLQNLRELGVKVATNIIIDYPLNGAIYRNCESKWMDEHFDYWTWNPYWGGVYDEQIAKERFEFYLRKGYKP